MTGSNKRAEILRLQKKWDRFLWSTSSSSSSYANTDTLSNWTTYQYRPLPQSRPVAPSNPVPPPKWGARVRELFGRLAKGGLAKDVGDPPALLTKGGQVIRPIAGAAAEAEVERRVEEDSRRKKIHLTRAVGITREKRYGKTETHRGTVTMVRAKEGPEHLRDNISLAVEGRDGKHVEIPIPMLREALDELAPETVAEFNQRMGGGEYGGSE